MISVRCPKCHVVLDIADDFVGQTKKCTKCGWLVSVTASEPTTEANLTPIWIDESAEDRASRNVGTPHPILDARVLSTAAALAVIGLVSVLLAINQSRSTQDDPTPTSGILSQAYQLANDPVVGVTEVLPRSLDKYEMTQIDITDFSSITATNVSVFGVYLGMPHGAVLARLRETPTNFYIEEVGSTASYWVYELDTASRRTELFVVNFESRDSGVARIGLEPEMAKYLTGSSKELVSLAVLNATSNVRRDFLGPATREVTTLSAGPNLFMKEYHFYDKNVALSECIIGDDHFVKFHIGIPPPVPTRPSGR